MDKDPKVDVALAAENELGEGPVWLTASQELLWVDIARGLIQCWSPDRDELRATAFQGEVSAVVPCSDGGFLLAIGHDLLHLDAHPNEQAGAPLRTLASVEEDRSENRFNDCRSDPQGRLWAGTMSTVREPQAAGLYRLIADTEIELVIPNLTLSNGIGWSPGGEAMYLIDSTSQQLDVLDFDGRNGEIANRRCLAEIAPEDGMPDGLAVDAEGGVWVCLFGGGAVRRYSPEGHLDEHIALPVPHPTCPAFGGEDLATMFVTSTRHRLTPQQLAGLPAAGSLFALRPGVSGLAANQFQRS